MHYLKYYVKFFYKELVGINIISRDNPWDFKIELSSEEVFNVEITSIADNTSFFKKMKYEERFVTKSFDKKIPLHELIKLNRLFPNSDASEKINSYLDAKLSKKEYVENPYKSSNTRLFWSIDFEEKTPLENLLQESIEKKELKKHSEKDKTALIIDNRTILYKISDLNSAIDSLSEFLCSSSFREIWFYTGYCSDLDGNNAEFSLAPLKVTDNQMNILEKTSNENEPDERGVIYIVKNKGT